jgi:hypothetical protein
MSRNDGRQAFSLLEIVSRLEIEKRSFALVV